MSRIILLLSFLLWSTGGPLLREARMPLANYVAAANLVGVGILVVIFGRRIRAGIPGLPRGRTWALCLVSAVNVLTAAAAVYHTKIGNVIILHYIAPVIVALFSPVVLGEKPGGRAWTALAISMAGLGLFGREEVDFTGGREMTGVILAFSSAFAYATVILLIRGDATRGADPITLTVLQSAFLWVCVLPFLDVGAFHARGIAIASLAGILHLSLAAVLYVTALRHIPAAVASILGYSEIVFALIWGAVLYGEEVSAMKAAAAALIAIAGAVALRARALEVPAPPGI
jgi:drug/metabolite transporter (DMT)-like permease